MAVVGFDHVAIPTAKPEEMMRFYRLLGFVVPTYEQWRTQDRPSFSVQFGDNKINMLAPALWQNPAFTLRGPAAQPGCGDFCFVWSGTLEELTAMLEQAGAAIEEGPVERVGGHDGGRARGTSVYLRDPDGNLLEFIVYGQ
jgi:catechol 2,3-dioxygenase-like lactoylglutathione lyase family enzyme